MLDAIRSFWDRRVGTGPAGDAGPGDDAVQVAAAALLLELAHADGEFSPEERAHIEGALGRHFALDEATVRELLATAEAARRQAIDHFQFTRLIAREYDLSQKLLLAEVMWGVILADGTVAEHEAWLVRKLANLLELEPGYLAQARRTAGSRRGG